MAHSKRNFVLPILVGAGLIAIGAIFALTDIASPLIQYIHTNSITPIGTLLCGVAAVVAFYTVFKVLSLLGKSFLPEGENDTPDKES